MNTLEGIEQPESANAGCVQRVVRRPEWKYVVVEADGHICSRHRKMEGALIRQRHLETKTSGKYTVRPYGDHTPTDTERLEWLLANKSPGPVCWYRVKGGGDEYLITSRAAIDKWMMMPNSKVSDGGGL